MLRIESFIKAAVVSSVAALLLAAACSRAPRPWPTPEPPSAKPAPAESQPAAKPAAKPAEQEPPPGVVPVEEKKAATLPIEENSLPDKDAAGALLEEAMASYQEAKAFREKGDLDGALKILDKSYELLLRANPPLDSSQAREKNDLRILIAQRIQEIYACRANPLPNGKNAILAVENKWVLAEINSFQTRERSSFLEAYKRSGLYRPYIVEELRKAGAPEDLSWLPVIESGFQPRALSYARALGLWQFIASTGYRYGLTRDRWIDERMDPFKATGAAIRFLIDLHAIFGDWATALASYNCGEFAVQRVINTQHVNYLDDFWDLFTRLPLQTARFVPRFMAVLLIVRNPQKYGFELPPVYAPLKWDAISVNKPIKLSALAASLGLDASELPFLNPELRYDSTPDRAYELKVPAGSAEKAMIAINTAPKYVPPEMSFSWHVVRSGDSLWTISRRYGTSVEMIIKMNGMRPPYLILPGHRIKVPGKGGVAD